MAPSLNLTTLLQGNGAYLLDAVSGPSSLIVLGQGGFGITLPQLAYGNAAIFSGGVLQCNDWYINPILTIGAGATVSLNLNGGALANPFGTPLVWTFLKYVLLAPQAPDGSTVSINVGPQGVANAAQLWFGGVGASSYEQLWWPLPRIGPAAGWPLTPSTNLLPIKNPGANPINVAVLLAGGH